MDTTASAITASLARAAAAGLTVTDGRPGPAIHAGHRSLGFITIGDDVDLIYCDSLTRDRATHTHRDAAGITAAVAAFITGATA